MMTLGQLLDQLAAMGDAPRDTLVRINGEYVHSCTVQISNPIVEKSNDFGMRELSIDPQRPQVVDIAANGCEIPDLPIVQIGRAYKVS